MPSRDPDYPYIQITLDTIPPIGAVMGGRVVCNDPTLQTQLPTYRYPDPATIPYVPLRVSVVFSR
jgi:hypothetical protein